MFGNGFEMTPYKTPYELIGINCFQLFCQIRDTATRLLLSKNKSSNRTGTYIAVKEQAEQIALRNIHLIDKKNLSSKCKQI